MSTSLNINLNTNLIIQSNIVANQAVDNTVNFNVITSSGFATVQASVTAGTVYSFSGLINLNSARVRFQGSGGAFISGITLTGMLPLVFTAPVGATAAVFNCKEPTQPVSVYSSLQLVAGTLGYNDSFAQSSIFCALGDSFIANAVPKSNWLDIITADMKLSCVPIGGSGYAVTQGTGANGTPLGSILSLLSQVYTAAPNIVLLQGGTNDCFYKMPIGNITDLSSNQNTYYGAYKYMVEQLLLNLPGVRIMILVPPKRAVSQSGTYQQQIPYTAVPINVGEIYSIPVLNLFHSAWTDSSLQAATNPTTADGAHPSAYGGAILSRLIIAFMKQFM